MDKRKRFKLNLEIFKDIFKICPRVQGQDFDALPTDQEIVPFLRDLGHTEEINSLNDVVVDQMHKPWRTFASLINRSLSGKTTDKLRLSRAQILWGMYHQKNVAMLNYFGKISFTRLTTKPTKIKRRCTTIDSPKLSFTTSLLKTRLNNQIYDAILPESLTSPEMKETKAYKTYLGYATGATPPKKARKFKKPAFPKLTTIPISPEESTGKSKRVKRPAKKSTKDPERGVVIRETPKMPLSEKKEKHMRDFHKTHPSGSGTVTKTAPSATKIKPLVTSEETGVKPRVPDVTEEESSKSEAESWGNDEYDSNNEQESSGKDSDQENDSDDDKTQSDNENESDSEHESDKNESDSESDHQENEEEDEDDEEEVKDEFVKTPSNDSDDEDEIMITDKAKGDEDEEMDYTTSQLYDDVDIRLNEPVDTNKGFIQEEGTNAKITNIHQGNENPEISQVIEDAHVTLSTVLQKIDVPVTSSSHSSDLAAKFLNFSDIPHTDAEISSPMDVHVHHEVPIQQTPTLLTVPVSVIYDSSLVFSTVIPQSLPSFTYPPQQSTSTPPPTTKATNPPSTLLDFTSVFQFNNRVIALEKEVSEIKKDPLHTQVTALVDDHLDARLGETKDEFMNFLSASLTARITEQVKNQLPQILPEEESSQPQSSYEAAATLIEFELKKILIDKMDKSKSYLAAPEHRECYEGLIKSYDLDKTIFSTYDRGLKKRKTSKDAEPVKSEELEFEVVDLDMPQDQEENPGNDDEEPKEKTFGELMSTPIDFSAYIMNGLKITNLTQEILLGPTFRLLKGTHSNYAELEYDFEECYKALSEKLDWENPEGGDYPVDLTKPLPLVMS
ncbi:hypothetical protein Tco_1321078 [Tanacetum coccineum]